MSIADDIREAVNWLYGPEHDALCARLSAHADTLAQSPGPVAEPYCWIAPETRGLWFVKPPYEVIQNLIPLYTHAPPSEAEVRERYDQWLNDNARDLGLQAIRDSQGMRDRCFAIFRAALRPGAKVEGS